MLLTTFYAKFNVYNTRNGQAEEDLLACEKDATAAIESSEFVIVGITKDNYLGNGTTLCWLTTVLEPVMSSSQA